MLSLLIDTCTERSITAIVEDGHLDYFAGLPFGLHNSNFLLPKIDEGFLLSKKQPKNLDFIVVGVGPGSYTGIRVGATVAKTLSYTLKIPLIGVCTLEGFLPDCDGPFAAIIDAKMSGVYLMTGEKDGDTVTYTSEPKMCSLENLPEMLGSIDLLVCPSCESLKKRVEPLHPTKKWTWEETAQEPLHMTRRALEKFKNKEYSVDGTLNLLYMRD